MKSEERVAELEAAIRTHRDARGDDRCWMDDAALYAHLPEGAANANTALPPEEAFIKNCRRFWRSRQEPTHLYMASWWAENDRMRKALNSLRCPESHNTGFGSCRCTTNEVIDAALAGGEDAAVTLE